MATHQLTQDQIDVLKELTGSEERVHEWHKEFLADCPTGEMTREIMNKQYNEWFPQGNVDRFTKFAFKAFDVNNDGKLSFDEFVVGTLLFANDGPKLSKENKQKQIDLFFNLFDANGDGQLSVEEIKRVLVAFISMEATDSEETAAVEAFSDLQATQMIEKLGQGSDTINKEQLAKALKEIDGLKFLTELMDD